MTRNWATKPLGDVCDILDRLRKPITKRDRISGPYPYYGATGVLDHVADYIFDEPLVLIGEDGAKWEVGENSAFSIEGKTWVNNHAHVIRPHRNELLDDWLIYFLNASDLMPFVSGMTVPKLNQGRLREIPIPIPSPEEQQRIVAVLDEAFEGLDRARVHAEANLRDGQELFDGAISASFANLPEHSTHSTLGQIATFRNGLNFTRTSQGDKVKVAGVGDFKDNFEVPISEINCTRIDSSLDESDCLNAGDILAVRSNGNRKLIGRTMLVPELDEPISFSGFTIRIRLKSDRISPEYLCSYMRTNEARAMLTAGGGGTNISNLNQRLLSSFPIVFPDIDVQVKILGRLERIQSTKKEIIQRYEDTISNVHDLRQSLLQRAFAGELT